MLGMATLGLAGPATAQAVPYEGVSMHSMWDQVSPTDMAHELDLAAAAHSNVVRVDVGWSGMEMDGPGQMSAGYLAKLDQLVSAAAARGLKVLPVVFSTPCWASSAPDSIKQGCAGQWWTRGVNLYPPSDPGTYARFMAWMVGRYGSQLAAVELWNEPDADGQAFWVSPNPAGDYAALVRAAYPAIKAVNRSVPVLAGSLSGGDARFLRELYANGMRGYYDGLAVHPYNGSLAPGQPSASGYERWTMLTGLNALRQARSEVGDTAPMWATEFGWSTAGSPQLVTAALQATYLSAAIPWLRGMPDIAGSVVFELRAMGDSADNDGFALTNADFSPRPAYAAVQAAMATRPPGDPGTPSGGGSGGSPGGSGKGSTGGSTSGPAGTTTASPTSPSGPATTSPSSPTTPPPSGSTLSSGTALAARQWVAPAHAAVRRGARRQGHHPRRPRRAHAARHGQRRR